MPYLSQSAPDAGNILNALAKQVRLVRQHEQIDDDAGRIHLDRADQRLSLVLQHRPHVAVADAVIGIAHVDAHHQRRLVLSGNVLQQVGLAVIHLDRVRCCRYQRGHHGLNIFKSVEEGRFVADAVIDRHVEAAAVAEQPVHPDFAVVSHCVLLGSFLAESVS